MSVLTILEVPDPGLRAVAKPVAQVDDAVRAIISNMFDTMYDARGIGLAATQVGIEQRIVVIDLQEPESDAEDAKPVRNPLIFVNPELVSVSEESNPAPSYGYFASSITPSLPADAMTRIYSRRSFFFL